MFVCVFDGWVRNSLINFTWKIFFFSKFFENKIIKKMSKIDSYEQTDLLFFFFIVC